MHAMIGEIPRDPDLTLLSPAELMAASRMTARRRAEFAYGRTLLRRVAAQVLGQPADTPIEASADANGALVLAGVAAGASISHSRGVAAAAFCVGGRVGVDVERVAEPAAATLRRWARLPAYSDLSQLRGRERAERFTRTWTVQEACAKAVGSGLAARPWHIPVDTAQGRGSWGQVRWMLLDGPPTVAFAVATAPLRAPAWPAS